MSKHTPGPWPIRQPNGNGWGFSVGPAWLGTAPWSRQTAADARLIAAAPDLLAALSKTCEAMVTLAALAGSGVPWSALDNEARAAIAKATGAAT